MKKNYLRFGLAAASLLAMGCSTTDGDGAYENYYFRDGLTGSAYSLAGEEMGEVPESGDKFDDFTDNPFVKTADEPVSTFSVDADGASYAIMRRYLTSGYNINPSSVRIEEFLNYFTFN